MGISLASDCGILAIRGMLSLKFVKLLLFANCWKAEKIRSASIVAGVFYCGIVVDSQNLLPSACLKTFQNRSRDSFLKYCQLVVGVSWDSVLHNVALGYPIFQDEYHSGSPPHSFPGLCNMGSGGYPQQIRSGSDLAGSDETHQVGRDLLEGYSPSYWTPVKISLFFFFWYPHRL